MALLLPVLLVALTAFLVRRLLSTLRRRQAQARRARRPGASADHPLALTSPRVLDEAKARLRCACGGAVQDLGEATRAGVRVARGRCIECGADVDLFFFLSSPRA